MGIPVLEGARIGAYIVKQHLLGRKRYPLVLMLEPLFRCNLACAGCGKIDYPDKILNQRLPFEDCMEAIDECGAPVVVIAGGEPLLHKEIGKIVEGVIARKKFVILCTNALLLEKKMDEFKPSPYLQLVGPSRRRQARCTTSRCARTASTTARSRRSSGQGQGLPGHHQLHPVQRRRPRARREVLRHDDGAWASTASRSRPAMPMSARRTRSISSTAPRPRNCSATSSARRQGPEMGLHPVRLFLDFLAGNQNYHCTPWGNPPRNVFGWQRPCYLLGEGYAKTFKELMETTDWDAYGVGNYEKCADCMVHCGFEPSAVTHAVKNPLAALKVALFGVETEKPMVAGYSAR